jgi:hypothetical protein
MSKPIMSKWHVAGIVVVMTLVGVSLFLANVVGFEGGPGQHGYWCFGWPVMYQMRPREIETGLDLYCAPTSRWLFVGAPADIEPWRPLWEEPLAFNEPAIMWVDIYLGLLILGTTFLVMISQQLSQFRRQSTRHKLTTMTLLAVLLGLMCGGSLRWWPAVTYKPLVFFPIVFGMLCVVLTFESLVVRAAALLPVRKRG